MLQKKLQMLPDYINNFTFTCDTCEIDGLLSFRNLAIKRLACGTGRSPKKIKQQIGHGHGFFHSIG